MFLHQGSKPLLLAAALSLCGVVNAEAFFWSNFNQRLARNAFELTRQSVRYDQRYYRIAYPMGDVPADRGACTDVVVRAYRKMGIDLQQKVHEDMRRNFTLYPRQWRQQAPDSNIDHRRVPNLMTFFQRHGKALQISYRAADYKPGDIVCWVWQNGMTHIGIVAEQKTPCNSRHMIIHNKGAGQQLEDYLFKTKIIGHYRYSG